MPISSDASPNRWQRTPSWFRKILLPILVLAILAGGAWYFWMRPASPPSTDVAGKASGPAGAPGASGRPGGPGGGGGRFGGDPNRLQPVAAVPAKQGDINVVQNGLGTVAALKVATVKARVDGLLQNVSFKEGQIVKAGELLAEIDPQPLRVQLSQVEGQLARDQAQLANARLDLERYRTLLAQDSIAKQQLDAQEAQVKQFEGTVKIDQAQVDNARLQLSYTRITAPISGRLGLRQLDAGNIIRQSDAAGLVVITQVDPITVVFTIPQDNLPRVLKQLKAGAKLTVDAWDRDSKNKLATGFLLSADNQIDIATGTIKMKAQFPNVDGLLFPNQFVNIRMVVDTRKNATVIPLAAIQRGARGIVVYVVKEDKTVSMRPVVMGPVEGDNVLIESGVAPGELVVVDGIDRLREGAKVEVTAPFVPRVGPPGGRGGDPSKRGGGNWGGGAGKPAAESAAPSGSKDGKAEGKADGKPATGSKAGDAATPNGAAKAGPQAGETARVRGTPPPAEPVAGATAAPSGGGQGGGPGGGPGGGGWRNMTDEQKAELRKKMESMTDEQKAEFRRKMRERAGQ